MTSAWLLFILGLFMTALGGDSFVGSASGLAKKLRLPPVVIGATIVSAGTTLPEILVSTTAAVGGSPQIATGNALGSIICNSALVGGIGALMLPPKNLSRRDLAKRLLFFLAAGCFTVFSASKTGRLGTGLGIILLSLFAVYTVTSAASAAVSANDESGERPELICVSLIVSAAALYIGSKLLIDNGIIIARALGVPQRILALTVVALGTSIPELATTISAAAKKQSALGLGNIIGANIMNLLLVIGLPCIIAPMEVGAEFFRDAGAACGAMLALMLPPLFTGKMYRWQGGLLLAAYAIWCALGFITAG